MQGELWLIICGGRGYGEDTLGTPESAAKAAEEEEFFDRYMDRFFLHFTGPFKIIEGGAKGADTLARKYAAKRGIPSHRMDADWSAGKSGGIKRNETMLTVLRSRPHTLKRVVAFPGGVGTNHMCDIAEAKGVKVIKSWRVPLW